MEETLLAFAPAILAVAVAVFLRVRRSTKEASDETTALQKRVTALEQRIRELERAHALPARPMMRPATAPPITPTHQAEPEAQSLPLTESQKEVAELLNQLYVMKAQLSLDPIVEEKYITELNGVVDRLERVTGCDLNRWLGIPSQDRQPGAASDHQKTDVSKGRIRFRNRDLFRLQIVSLQAFCEYQTQQSNFVPAPPEAARVIH